METASPNIVIPYYSSYGTTHKLAQAVAAGASLWVLPYDE